MTRRLWIGLDDDGHFFAFDLLHEREELLAFLSRDSGLCASLREFWEDAEEEAVCALSQAPDLIAALHALNQDEFEKAFRVSQQRNTFELIQTPLSKTTP